MSEEVKVLLSQVSSNITEVFVKMSSVKQQDKSECFAAVGRILHQLGCLVSIKLSNSDANSNLKYQYYNLSYEGEEPLTTTVMITEENMITAEMKDEESMITAEMKDEENMITLRPGAEADVTISRVLAAISSIAPSSIYDKKRAMRKRRKRMKTMICPELFPIWSNAASILSPVTNSMQSSTSSFPNVDWKSVNKRFLSNIPSPTSLPIHGCFSSAEDYEDVFQKNDYGGIQNLGSKFTRDFPFGSELGFLTDAGPVSVPNDVFHGYTYQPG